jgi:hypothetical protein
MVATIHHLRHDLRLQECLQKSEDTLAAAGRIDPCIFVIGPYGLHAMRAPPAIALLPILRSKIVPGITAVGFVAQFGEPGNRHSVRLLYSFKGGAIARVAKLKTTSTGMVLGPWEEFLPFRGFLELFDSVCEGK